MGYWRVSSRYSSRPSLLQENLAAAPSDPERVLPSFAVSLLLIL